MSTLAANNANPAAGARSPSSSSSMSNGTSISASAAVSSPHATQQLCASCDRCRARKTKCDGVRPCGNCVTRYRKVNKCESLEGVDLACFDCVYSPAKRRGPIPGRSSHSRASAAASGRAAATAAHQNQFLAMNQTPSPVAVHTGLNNGGGMFSLGLDNGISASGVVGGYNPQLLANNGNPMMGNIALAANAQGNNGSGNFSADELKQMLALQQQLLVQQQQMQAQQQQQGVLAQLTSMTGQGGGGGGNHVDANLQQVVTNSLAANSNNSAAVSGGIVGGLAMMGGLGSVVPSQFVNHSNTNNGSSNGSNGHQVFQAQVQQPQVQPQPQFFQQQQLGVPNQMSVQNQVSNESNGRQAKRTAMEPVQSSNNLPNSVTSHLPLLKLNNPEGTLLRSYYELSTNDTLNLPAIPTDEEYSERLASAGYTTTSTLPTYDQSALHAARFSELALGALANNQLPLALELSNASVMCLRNCVEEPSHKSCMYDVARAYLLHGIFRSFRGDMVRYFKYRRVCMTHIMQLNTEPNVEALLAAISFHDAWAYLMHNATEAALPDIGVSLPPLNNDDSASNGSSNGIKAKYGCCTNSSSVASDPLNQMWMQGSPPVFLNNEACPVSRSLDAFACAVRTCCDQANHQFDGMAKAAGISNGDGSNGQQGHAGATPTLTAVMANENELCGRNIVMSAQTLIRQHQGTSNGRIKKHGLTMVGLAMSAFLENGDASAENGSSDGSKSIGGFTDGQIKNLMAACDIIIQHPILLHSPGPVYHMSSNAAIMLCHLLNGIHASCGIIEHGSSKGGSPSPYDNNQRVEGVLFDDVLDTFMAMRKVLNIHRKSLPVKLRCHGIPRPSGVGPFKKGQDPEAAFIDMGETLMCLCRGCQGFVLMGCSPCVAAERSMQAAQRTDEDNTDDQQQWKEADNEFERQIGEMDGLDLDDDALLEVLSRIVQN